MSAAAPPGTTLGTTLGTTVAYRDDGPLAAGAGRLGRRAGLPVRALPVTAGGAALALVGLAAGLVSGTVWAAAAGAACCVTLAGPAAGRAHAGRLDWLVPPVLRATEYAFLVALGLHAGTPPALVFGVLAAAVYHHYDVVYRHRHRVGLPGGWLARLGLGWDGRMLAYALGGTAALMTPLLAVLAAGLWGLFAGESVTCWVRAGRRAPGDTAEGEPAD